jgi:hypothetical protein
MWGAFLARIITWMHACVQYLTLGAYMIVVLCMCMCVWVCVWVYVCYRATSYIHVPHLEVSRAVL